MQPLALFCLMVVHVTGSVAPAGSDQTYAQLTAVLRSFTQAQTAYRASHGRYTASLSALGVQRTPGISVRLQAEGAAGFSA
ncbi:MAG TPA: hypothetical protein VF665_22275, partial [Longimicrobium sp.]|uniref:hypothetical protein n=1 Tax=Longimicrobium sp. TaxID=2029185 RepID=UPI002EDB7C20